jgi:hypothetical protein
MAHGLARIKGKMQDTGFMIQDDFLLSCILNLVSFLILFVTLSLGAFVLLYKFDQALQR